VTATRVDLLFASNALLRASSEVYGKRNEAFRFSKVVFRELAVHA
jgi:catalase (peroxidase I)